MFSHICSAKAKKFNFKYSTFSKLKILQKLLTKLITKIKLKKLKVLVHLF